MSDKKSISLHEVIGSDVFDEDTYDLIAGRIFNNLKLYCLEKNFWNSEDNKPIINQDTLGTKGKCVSQMKKLLEKDISQKIVLDNTNSKLVYRNSFTNYLNSKEIKYCLVSLDVNKEQSFFLDNFRCKLDKKERLSDIVIHSYFKYQEEPQVTEGFDKIFKVPFVPEFNSMDDITLFNQYY